MIHTLHISNLSDQLSITRVSRQPRIIQISRILPHHQIPVLVDPLLIDQLGLFLILPLNLLEPLIVVLAHDGGGGEVDQRSALLQGRVGFALHWNQQN